MRSFKTGIRYFLLATLLLLGSQNAVHASGFALIELNATGQGNAYAGAAVGTNNASTVYFNPAGMMNFDGDQLVLAGHFIEPSADFTNDGSSLAAFYTAFPPANGADLSGEDDDGGQGAFVPNLYWVKTINESMKFGLGFNSPFGLAVEYDEDWVGRYHAVESDLKTININPSLAYRVNDRVVIGGGLNVVLADVILTSAVDMGSVCVGGLVQNGFLPGAAILQCEGTGAAPQEFDGFADLTGENYDDFGFGFNLGLTFAVNKQTRIGVSYRSEVEINVEGEADFTIPAGSTGLASLDGVIAGSLDPVSGDRLFDDVDLEATVDLPASFSVSVAHTVGKYTWLADWTRTGWSSFEELRIKYDSTVQPDTVTTEDWDDTNRYSFGLDYRYSDKMILRTGVALDETPVPSSERRTPRLPGNDRTWLSFGLTYLVNPQFSVDVGYSHLFVDDAKIENEYESGFPTLTHTLQGEYEAEVDILSAQLNWNLP
jgi:long-chain fatty acid transport protein